MKAGFIGAGKVGFSLGKYLSINGITITGYYSHNASSAMEAASFTQSKYYDSLEKLVQDSDTIFITVPDGIISNIYKEISKYPIMNKYICHCSGSISSTVFFDAEEKGAFRYSVHPLFAISDKYESYKSLNQAIFAIEGSKTHLKMMKFILEGLGNKVVLIDGNSKTKYHAAAVMVSNQMAALCDIGVELLMNCGFERHEAEAALGPLIQGNASKIAEVGPVRALTGPVERGDITTIREHLEVLEGDTKEVYVALSKRLVDVAQRKHPDRVYDEILKELEK